MTINEFAECLLRHARADYLIEGLRAVYAYPFESFELLPGWMDGVYFYGQSLRSSELMVLIKESSKSIAKEHRRLGTIDSLHIVEGPVFGEYMSAPDRDSVRDQIKNIGSQFSTNLVEPTNPRVKRLFFSLHVRPGLGPPSQSGSTFLGPIASQMDAQLIIPDWEPTFFHFESQQDRLDAVEHYHQNYEAELALRNPIAHDDALAMIRSEFNDISGTVSLLTQNHIHGHRNSEALLSIWMRARQF
jgi:hypothetical protein